MKAHSNALMRVLNIIPYLLLSWTMLIFAYESYNDKYYLPMLFYLALAILFGFLAKRKYQNIKTSKHKNRDIIVTNIALLPLLYANLYLSTIVAQAKPIDESGMIYVLVPIYTPMLYIGSHIILSIYSYFHNQRYK
jgi:membrane protease YdiL (CAAX protease family)